MSSSIDLATPSGRALAQSPAWGRIAAAVSAACVTLAVAALGAGAAAAGAAGKGANVYDPKSSDDQMRVSVKMSCSLIEGKPTLYWWSGRMWARVPGEPNRLVFNVHGMNMRQCRTKQDPVRGFCYRSVSREVMFYIDPATGEVARKWKNPWSGKEVDVVHVANDPVNARDWFCARDKEGKPIDRSEGQFIKDDMLLEGGGAARLFYKNPLAGEYQDYVGGAYHAMEFGSSAVMAKEAMDARDTELENAVISWGRISNWLPWMEMGDRDGMVVFHTAGMRLDRYEQMPEVVRREIELNYPIYRDPPPLDDPRPNETSWTVFKKYIDAKRAEEASKQAGKDAAPAKP